MLEEKILSPILSYQFSELVVAENFPEMSKNVSFFFVFPVPSVPIFLILSEKSGGSVPFLFQFGYKQHVNVHFNVHLL